MKKLIFYSLISLSILSCSVYAPDNSSPSPIKKDTSSLSPQTPLLGGAGVGSLHPSLEFTDLEKEYKSFSTKALSNAYVSRMFNKYLKTGQENPTQVIRQLEFARYLKNNGDTSYYDSLKTNINTDNTLFGKIIGVTEVSQKMTNEPATFKPFVETLAPIAGVTPVATPATNIIDISFTANWNKVNYATGYVLYVSNGTTTTTYNISGVNTLSYNLTGLTSGINYSYYVKAVNADGQSQSSNIINVLTLAVGKLSATANVSYVTDGNTGTFWNSGGLCCGQTIVLNLGTIKTVNKVRLFPEATPCGTEYYNVSTSTDGTNYTLPVNYSSACMSWGTHDITPVQAKYVRFYPTSWSGSWVAIREIEVYGY